MTKDVHLRIKLSPKLQSLLQAENTIEAKKIFIEILRKIQPNYVFDDNNKEVIGNVFRWCIRDSSGPYKLDKGLWILGAVGTGKSDLMTAVMRFIREYWVVDYDQKLSSEWVSASSLCDKFATDGYRAFDSLPLGIDDVGTETIPTNHMGNKLNVFAQAISTLYDSPWALPSVVTTNASIKELHDMYGARTIDRIGHMFNLVKLNGTTRRDSAEIWAEIEAESGENVL